MNIYFSRQSLIDEFPYTIKIDQHPDNRAFNWCIEELKIDFKKDFDVRASNTNMGIDFYFKEPSDYMAFKLRWR